MTNFKEVTETFQALNALAPEFFMPIENDGDLKRATDFLAHFDDDIKGEALHPLDPLAAALMHRIMAYEAARWPIADADAATMLEFFMDQHQETQQRVASATGISQSTISLLLSGKRAFTAEHARRLAAHFGCGADVFL